MDNGSRSASEKTERSIPMALELAVIGVSDIDRAKLYYSQLGWRLDIDFQGDDYRVVQFTPPGSACSVMFGKNITRDKAGSSRGLHLVVEDLEIARRDLLERGISVSEPFHDLGGIFHHANGIGVAVGMNPERKSYASYISFSDPDGNEWTIQEISVRLPGQPGDKRFTPQLSEAVWGGS